VKVDDEGNEIWSREHGRPNDTEDGRSVVEASDGGFLIGGYVAQPYGQRTQAMLLRTGPRGEFVWGQTWGGDQDDYGYSAVITGDGGCLLVGETGSFGPDWDLYQIRTDGQGNTRWVKTIDVDYHDCGYSVKQTTDGGFVIGGYSYSSLGDCDLLVVRTDSLGNTLWTRSFGEGSWDEGYSIEIAADGGFILAGVVDTPGNGPDGYLVRMDSSGNTMWTKTLGGTGVDLFYSVCQTADGGYAATGYRTPEGSRDTYLWAVRLAAEVPTIEVTFSGTPSVVTRGETASWQYRLKNNTAGTVVFDWWLSTSGLVERDQYLGEKRLDPWGEEEGVLRLGVPVKTPLGEYSVCGRAGAWQHRYSWDEDCFRCEVEGR
jgi:hypothetical protein